MSLTAARSLVEQLRRDGDQPDHGADLDLAGPGALYYPVSDGVAERGEGIYLIDRDGRRFMDCASGTFNLSLGYGHPEVVATIKEQADKLIHLTSSIQAEPVNRLTQRLIDVAPTTMVKVHPKVSGGSSANEGAIKMAQQATGKRDVITMFRSHHGQTFATMGISGHAFRREPFPYVFPGSMQVPDAYCRRCFYNQRPETCGRLCVDRIEDFVDYASSGSVACILIEPISGAGGNIVPPDGYFERLRELCDRLGMALIFDEVQTGIGRTGKMFASQHFGVEPDAITVGKGLGGSGMQIAAVLTNEALTGLSLEHHAFTHGGNVLAAAVADKTLEIMQRPGFLEGVRHVGEHIKDRLRASQRRHPFIFDVRGVGLMIGVEITRPDGRRDPQLTNRLVDLGRREGLLLRTSEWGRGNVVKIRPPLIMSHAEAAEMCDRLDRAFAASQRS